jgi:hypothetical protein
LGRAEQHLDAVGPVAGARSVAAARARASDLRARLQRAPAPS